MNNVWLKRFGAATGAIFFLLVLLPSNGGGNDLTFHASPAQIATWIQTTSPIIAPTDYVSGLVELLAFLFLLVFVAYLSSVLRQAEGDRGFLSTVVLSAGILAVAVKIASVPPTLVADLWARDGVDPRVLGMLFDMGNVAFDLFLAAMALAVAAVAAVAIPTRALPRWLGWGTAVTASALVANVAFAYKTADFSPAMLLFLLWTLVTSVALVRRAGPATAPVVAPTGREPALAR